MRLANIGQTYGSASAVLSGLALLGIAVSLRLQTTQRLIDGVSFKQQRHHDMMRYVFEDQRYSQCWGPRTAPEGIDERLFFYTNIILGEWQESYRLGDLSRTDVRVYAAMMFKSEIPRLFWKQHGYLRRDVTRLKDFGDFSLIVSEEYEKAVEAGPPERLYEKEESGVVSSGVSGAKWRRLVACGAGIAASVALMHVATRLSSNVGADE